MREKPSLKEFCLVFWGDWGAKVSGVFSVPFTVATLLADSTKTKLIWGALAISAMIAAAYRIWSIERKQVCKLDDRLAPKLSIHFDENSKHFLKKKELPKQNPNDPTIEQLFIQVLVTSSVRLTGCVGRLCNEISIWKDGAWVSTNKPTSSGLLDWDTWGRSDIVIDPGSNQTYLQILTIGLDNNPELACFTNWTDKKELFTPGNLYKIDFSITYQECATPEFRSLTFKIGTTWETPEVKMLP